VTQQLSGASWPPASGTEHLQFEDPMMALNDPSGSTNGFERGNHIDRVLLIAGCAGEPSFRSLAAPASPLRLHRGEPEKETPMLIMVFTCIVVVTTLLPGAAGAQERLAPLSREDAIRMALERNPTLQAKQRELQSVRANETTAALWPNPTFNYLAEQFGATGQPQYTVSVGQTIETGGKRGRRIESARAATRVTGYELEDVRRQVIFQTQKAFTDVLVAQASQALAAANLTTLDELERIQRLRAEHGDISQLDLNRIQIQRFTFERDAADAAQAVQAAKIALRSVVGAGVLTEPVEVSGELTFRDLSLTREGLYQLAVMNRPDLRAAQAAFEKAQADVNLARANAWWDVTPLVEYQRIQNDNTIGFGISLPIRIFDRNQGEIARAKAEVQRLSAVSRAAAIQALAEVDTAWSVAMTERDKVHRLREIYLPKARQARDTVEFAYRRGGLSLLDFLDAQRAYRETALGEIQAVGNYESALNQLESAVGASLDEPRSR